MRTEYDAEDNRLELKFFDKEMIKPFSYKIMSFVMILFPFLFIIGGYINSRPSDIFDFVIDQVLKLLISVSAGLLLYFLTLKLSIFLSQRNKIIVPQKVKNNVQGFSEAFNLGIVYVLLAQSFLFPMFEIYNNIPIKSITYFGAFLLYSTYLGIKTIETSILLTTDGVKNIQSVKFLFKSFNNIEIPISPNSDGLYQIAINMNGKGEEYGFTGKKGIIYLSEVEFNNYKYSTNNYNSDMLPKPFNLYIIHGEINEDEIPSTHRKYRDYPATVPGYLIANPCNKSEVIEYIKLLEKYKPIKIMRPWKYKKTTGFNRVEENPLRI